MKPLALIVALASLLLQAAIAAAAPTTLDQGFFVSLRAAADSTVNHIVVTYGPPKQDQSEAPMWGNYLSDTAGIEAWIGELDAAAAAR